MTQEQCGSPFNRCDDEPLYQVGSTALFDAASFHWFRNYDQLWNYPLVNSRIEIKAVG
jgi:hypothetical protein